MGFALTPGEAPLHFSRSKNVMHVVAYSRTWLLLYLLASTRVRHLRKYFGNKATARDALL